MVYSGRSMMISDELLRVLRESKIFSGISEDHIGKIVSHGEILNIRQNEFIVEEGQVGHPLYVILEGQVDVFLPKKRMENSGERPTKIVLDRLHQGDCIGEYSLIDDKPASASVIASQPCRVFRLSKNEFATIITYGNDVEKTIYKNMLKVLIQRCRRSDSELDICY